MLCRMSRNLMVVLAAKSHAFCISGRSVRTSLTVSIASSVSISFCVVAGPSTGAMRSLALSTTSPRGIGLRTVPRTASTRSESGVPSVQRDLDDRHARRQQRASARRPGRTSPCCAAAARRVLHARLVVRGVERGRLVDQHHRDHVLKADVRNVAVVHDGADASGRGERRRPSHRSASNGRLLADVFDRVERRLNRRADGPLLDIGVDDFVPLAKLVDQQQPDRPSAR